MPPRPPLSDEPASRRHCITKPSACNYPDASNTGIRAGVHLTPKAGSVIVTSPGTTIHGLALTGSILIKANHTTVDDSDITVRGTQAGCDAPCGGYGIRVAPGVVGTIIRDVACHGGSPTGADVTEFCIKNNDPSTRVEHVYMYNCTTCMWGPGTWSDNLVDETGTSIPHEHYEDIYYGGGLGPLVVNHNTMMNPHPQTAVVFASVDFGDQTTLSITNNLMAGGGYVIYGGRSGSAGRVVGPVTVSGNRFSMLYFPTSGRYGTTAYFNPMVTKWSHNIWDETRAPVPG